MNQKTGFFSISMVRGLGGMFAGTLVGLVFTIIVRVLMGMPAWNAQPAWVVAAVFGVAGFMIGTGVMSDWFKWAKGEETPDHPEGNPNLKGWAKIFSVSYDHKVIGIQYGITALTLFMLAGTYAMFFRTELASPGLQFLTNKTYNTFMSLHGIVMIGATLLAIAHSPRPGASTRVCPSGHDQKPR